MTQSTSGTPPIEPLKPWSRDTGHISPLKPMGRKDTFKSTPVEPNLTSPLIPESILDGGKQRTLAVGFFVALLAWKLQTVYLAPTGPLPFDTTLKFMAVDTLAIWMLPVFRIPWLTFSKSATLIAMILFWVSDLFLTSHYFSWAFLLGAWRALHTSELSLTGSKIRARDLAIDAKSHLSARYVVNILPESTALLNPSNSPFCIDSGNVTIPIRLNGTEPIFVQIQRTDFLGETVLLNYTKPDIKRMTIDKSQHEKNSEASGSITYLGLPIYLPGSYKIKQVVDVSKMHVRLLKSETVVVQCPRAYLNLSDSSGADRCLGETQVPGIIVQGAPPLSVKYHRIVNGKKSTFTVDSIQPDKFTKETASLEWAKMHTMQLAADASVTSIGTWGYEIDSVTDCQGNVATYGKPSLHLITQHQFTVHARPTVNFANCDALNPMKLARGGKATLSLASTGSGSKQFLIENDETGQQFTVESDSFTIDSPGTYSIKGLSGQFCDGDILEPSSCLVYVPPEPSVDIKFEESSDKCVGATGAFANVTLTGTPPFLLNFYITENGNKVLRQFKTHKLRDRIEFHPSKAGTYTYEFIQLSDSLYRDIPINFHMQQSVHVRARATFTGRSVKRTCSGDRAAFDVALQGLPPLNLEYEIIAPSGERKQYSTKGIQSLDTLKIETPDLTEGGRHTISLISVQDQRNCKTALHEDNAYVDVRRQRPTVSFVALEDKMHIETLEKNAVGLPLKLSGEAPWTVGYEFENVSGERKQATAVVRKPNGEVLRVNGRGKFRLTSVHDALCPGSVASTQNEFTVDWIPRPNVTLGASPENRPQAQICQGVSDSLDLYLEGAAPFDVQYEVRGPRGVQRHKVHIAANHGALRMDTSIPGSYTYKIVGVADGYYSMGPVSKEHRDLIVRQKVNGRPNASILRRNKQYRSCTNSNIDDPSFEGIAMQLEGLAPFHLTLSMRNEGSGDKTLHTIEISKGELNDNMVANIKQIFKGLPLGRHTLSLIQIRDGTGCEQSLENNDPNKSVTITVYDAPTLSVASGKNHYCVGEKLAFNLDGAPPFEIVYEFNGKRQKVTTSSPFVRTATSPGNLTFISITDRASNCVSSLSSMDSVIVHELPSVRSLGDRYDIHEGDQTELQFKFTGAPPFAFTYTRSELNGGRSEAVESHYVTDVYDWEYSVLASAQGEYNVVALQDAYCVVQMR